MFEVLLRMYARKLRQTIVVWSAVNDDGVHESDPFVSVSPQLG